MLYIKKYEPTSLNQMKNMYDENLIKKLKNVCKDKSNFLNIFVIGSKGINKKILILNFIKEYYRIENLVTKSIQISNFTLVKSNYHIELNMDILTSYVTFENIVNYFTKSKNIYTKNYIIFILLNVRKANSKIRNIIKIIIEKKYQTCRFICIGETYTMLSSIISNFIILRICLPSKEKCFSFLKFICDQENKATTDEKINKIIELNYPKINNMVYCLQLIHLEKEFDLNNVNYKKIYIKPLIELIKSEKHFSIKILDLIHTFVVIPKNISTIIKDFSEECIKLQISDEKKIRIIKFATFYQYESLQISNDIYTLHIFVRKVQIIIKE